MDAAKPYLVVLLVNTIYAGMYLLSKAAFDRGTNTFVFVFYRQAFSLVFLAPTAIFLERKKATPLSLTILLKIFILSLVGITFSLNVYNIGLSYTTSTVASAVSNSIPVVTFILAVLLGMETVRLRSLPGLAKLMGLSLCFGGVLVIAFYNGPSIKLHREVLIHPSLPLPHASSDMDWVKGTFLLIISNFTWSLWMVFQGKVLGEYPFKLLFTTLQCLFSTIQSFCVAAAVVRDFSLWKMKLDLGLLAIVYCGVVVTGISFYLQAWCIEKKGPVFLAISLPLAMVITILVSAVLGEPVIVGSIAGGVLMTGGLYSVMWGKSREQTDRVKTAVIQNEKEVVEEISGIASPYRPL